MIKTFIFAYQIFFLTFDTENLRFAKYISTYCSLSFTAPRLKNIFRQIRRHEVEYFFIQISLNDHSLLSNLEKKNVQFKGTRFTNIIRESFVVKIHQFVVFFCTYNRPVARLDKNYNYFLGKIYQNRDFFVLFICTVPYN